MLHLTTQNFDICRMNHWQFSSDTPAKAGPEHPTLAVVMFYAVWCGKCAMMRPVIEDLEKKYQKKYFGSICFFEVETSESALLAAQYQTAGSLPENISHRPVLYNIFSLTFLYPLFFEI